MNSACIVSPNTECVHCFRKNCVQEFLKQTTLGKPLGEGVQGLVVEAIWRGKDIALKMEMLNVYPITMTNRTFDFVCKSRSQIPEREYAKAVKSSKRDIEKHSWVNTTQDFSKEIRVAKLLSDARVGPRVYFAGICKAGLQTPQGIVDTGLLAMERFDMTLGDFIGIIVQDSEYRSNRVAEFVKILRDLEILRDRAALVVKRHGDLHTGNVVLKLPRDFYLKSVNRLKVRLIDFGLDFAKGSRTGIVKEINDFIKKMKNKLFKKLSKHNAMTAENRALTT